MKITVYITSFNQRELLRQAVDSVLAQTLRPYEILIVDDASVDGSVDLICAYESRYPELVRSIVHEQNCGVTQSRVHALAAARGDFVTNLDGDDVYWPRKLEAEAEAIRQFDADVAFSNFGRFTDDPWAKTEMWATKRNQLPPPGDMYFDVLTRNFPTGNLFHCELVSRRAIERAGYHDVNLSLYEDYEWKIRIAADSRIAYTLEPGMMYRRNPHSLSKVDRKLHLAAFRYIYDKHRPEFCRRLPARVDEIEARFAELFARLSRPPRRRLVGRLSRLLIGR